MELGAQFPNTSFKKLDVGILEFCEFSGSFTKLQFCNGVVCGDLHVLEEAYSCPENICEPGGAAEDSA